MSSEPEEQPESGEDLRDTVLDDLNERVSASRNEWLRFVVDGQAYGISVLQVQEILCAGEVTPVSGAPPFVLGVINVRGDIVTVVDARRRLGLPARDPGEGVDWTVVMDINEELVGLVVDEVLEVQVLDDSKVEKFQGDTAFEVEGVIETDGGMMILVDASTIASTGAQTERHGAAA